MDDTPRARLILCDCAGSQTVDPGAIATATGLSCSAVHTRLCTRQIDTALAEMAVGSAILACGQEVARLTEAAESAGIAAPAFVDLRDRAGWSDEAAHAGPKQAALVADALLATPPARSIDVVSEGSCLILGPAAAVYHAAAALADDLAVTVLLAEGAAASIPPGARFDVIAGTLEDLSGALGSFACTFADLRLADPAGRGALGFGPPRAAVSACDIVLDLSGCAPRVPHADRREGYLMADPSDPAAVGAAILAAARLRGTFEKPLHVRVTEPLCAHSRAGQIGCTRCLDVCPAGAIVPAGDHVAVDPMLCAGCGGCSSLCPSGAIAYDAPPVDHTFRRIELLARSYRTAGGSAPRLLVHDDAAGAAMIRDAARYGAGLPAATIPMALPALPAFGHAEMLAALACGFARVDVLLTATTERAALTAEITLARALAPAGTLDLIGPATPDALAVALRGPAPAPLSRPVLPMGTRRQIARLSARALQAPSDASVPDSATGAGPVPLPAGAAYGAVLVDTDACTLCLSCVSLCPSGALGDNPDRPQLLFQEDACLQCGLCETICPEDAITLEPRMDLSDAALSQRVLNEEEPALCVECGAAFGVQSTVERVATQLAGKHAMFATGDAARMIRMCDRCRVNAQYHAQKQPMGAAPRPRVRTTDDYLAERAGSVPDGRGRRDH